MKGATGKEREGDEDSEGDEKGVEVLALLQPPSSAHAVVTAHHDQAASPVFPPFSSMSNRMY